MSRTVIFVRNTIIEKRKRTDSPDRHSRKEGLYREGWRKKSSRMISAFREGRPVGLSLHCLRSGRAYMPLSLLNKIWVRWFEDVNKPAMDTIEEGLIRPANSLLAPKRVEHRVPGKDKDHGRSCRMDLVIHSVWRLVRSVCSPCAGRRMKTCVGASHMPSHQAYARNARATGSIPAEDARPET